MRLLMIHPPPWALWVSALSLLLSMNSAAVGADVATDAQSADIAKTSPAPPLQIQVDPRVELVSVLFRLAGNSEYNQGKVASYTDDVEKQFGPFRDHAAVKLARKLRQSRGVSYDACMSLAVHLSGVDDLQTVVPLKPWPGGLDERWTPEDVDKFLKRAREFVKDTSFRRFLEQHQRLYQETVSRMKRLMEQEGHLEWFADFFGERASANFTIALALLNGGCCYGPRCIKPDAPQQLYCVLGVWQTDHDGLPEFSSGMVGTVVHEFGHSYANPVIERHLTELLPAGDELFRAVAGKMRSQAYAGGRTLLCESLVRACEVRYAACYQGADAARSLMNYEKGRGFLWTEELSSLLADYEGHRDQYTTLESFSPRLVGFFREYSKGFAERQSALQAKRPKLLWMTPTNGAVQVDPGLTNMQVAFDRPMQNGSWALVGDPSQCPEGKGKPSFNAARTIWTVPVKLKPEFTYQFMLNAEGFDSFRSEEGVPLEPVAVTFTTGK